MTKYLNKIMALMDRAATRRIPAIVLFSLGASLLEMLGLGILPVFVQLLASPDQFAQTFGAGLLQGYVQHLPTDRLIVYSSMALLGFFVVKTLYMSWVYFLQADFMREVMEGVGKRIFAGYLWAPYSFHLQIDRGEIIRNVTHYPQYYAGAVVISVLRMFLHAIIIVGIAALLFWMHPKITLAALILPAFVAWIFMRWIRKSTLYQGAQLQTALAYLTGLTGHALGSIKETHIRGCQPFLLAAFEKEMHKIGEAHRYQKFVPAVAKPVMELFGVFVFLSIILIFIDNQQTMHAAAPVLVLFLVATARLIQNIFPITQSITSIRTYAQLVDAIVEEAEKIDALRRHECVEEHGERITPGRDAKEERQGDVSFENVSFRYHGTDRWAVEGVSLSIPAGTFAALVGLSGSGKSTVLDLLLGLLKPTRGVISIGGRDLADVLPEWRSGIGYVPQSIYLLDDSIRNNVAFGVAAKDIDDGQVWEVLRLAQIDDYVRSLPKQLDAPVGDFGVRLSGGQRQRIGIARALYHSPRVLILDEATAALDAVTEQALFHGLMGSGVVRNILLVTHRLSTVQYCDLVFFMADGRLIAQGTYQQLVATNETFSDMVKHGVLAVAEDPTRV